MMYLTNTDLKSIACHAQFLTKDKCFSECSKSRGFVGYVGVYVGIHVGIHVGIYVGIYVSIYVGIYVGI